MASAQWRLFRLSLNVLKVSEYAFKEYIQPPSHLGSNDS